MLRPSCFTRPILVLVVLLALQACGLDSPEFNANQPTAASGGQNGGDTSGATSSGRTLYAAQCAGCHGDTGQGGNGGGALNKNTPFETLVTQIRTTMPLGNASRCGQSCSEDIARYINAGFSVESGDSGSNGDGSNGGGSNGGGSNGGGSNGGGSNGGGSNGGGSGGDGASSEQPRITCGPDTAVAASVSAPAILMSSMPTVMAAESDASESVTLGKADYENPDKYCVGCHGLDGKGSGSDSKAIDLTKSNYDGLTLSQYIAQKMPGFNPGLCDGACADNVAAYIQSWAGSDPEPEPDPGDGDGDSGGDSGGGGDVGGGMCSAIQYGPRSLRVLTAREFSNSIEYLTGLDIREDLGSNVADALPADLLIDGYSNNVISKIDSGTLKSYEYVVGKVIEALKEQNFKSVIDCDAYETGDACISAFLADYVPRVMRRPATEQETGLYRHMFSADIAGGSLTEGMALALKTLFTSPQFLYRDETGVSVADIKAGNPGGGNCGAPTGTVYSLVPEGSPKTLDLHGNFGNNVQMTGKDLVEVTVRGVRNPTTGEWPIMRIQLDGTDIADMTINHDYDKTYQFVAEGFKQYSYIQMFNKQSTAANSHVAGHQLVVSALNVSGAGAIEYKLPDVPLDDDAYVLTPHQLASYLAFTYTGTTPDDTLLAAANAGELETDEQIATQIGRLLKTQRARDHFGDFAAQWLRTDKVLELNKDTEIYPGWTPAVQEAMAKEVREVFNHVVLDEGEAFTTLFNGNYTFANQTLAEFYGLPAVAGGELQKVTGVTSRAGLVTSGAFLAVHAHEDETAPILRATYLRRRLLCQNVPAPPTGVSLNPDGSEVNVDEERQKSIEEWEAYLAANNGLATARKKYEHQTSASLCQSCHKTMINPLGFGLEDFDAVGLPQSVEHNGLEVDASGQLIGINTVEDGQIITFNGAKDLAHQIAELDVTRRCFIDNSFRLAMGTGPTYFDRQLNIDLSAREKQDYQCQVDKLNDIMTASDNSTIELLKALGTMSTVRYRKDVER